MSKIISIHEYVLKPGVDKKQSENHVFRLITFFVQLLAAVGIMCQALILTIVLLVQALIMLKARSVKCIVVTGASRGFPRLMEQSFMVLRRLTRLFIVPSTACAKTWVSVRQPECLM
jgi:hypothetical protein